MTEISPAHPHAEPSLASVPAAFEGVPLHNGFAPAAEPSDGEAPYRCICKFADDDGYSVYCEECRTWQHKDCYYPDNTDVPDIHMCVICDPRPCDAAAAAERQRKSRAEVPGENGDRKQKRPAAKTSRKKPRDAPLGPPSGPLLNGSVLPDLAFGHDGMSLPDQPAQKRPKTSHRPSSSTTSAFYPPPPSARKRTNSVAVPSGSPTKSPSSPVVNGHHELYSPEFMRLYDHRYVPTQTNSFLRLAVSDNLTAWLNDVEKLRQVTNGKTQHEVFQRWDSPWEELENVSPGVTKHRYEDAQVTVGGKHPVYEFIIADNATPAGAFIGEINGQIYGRDEYITDPANRWETLRHPEPFVFFNDKLPICIDARAEGSMLRFVRRSCQPNTRMQIIIVGQQYHFCLVSEQAIAQQQEITIGWNIDETFNSIVKKAHEKRTIDPEEELYVTRWVSVVKANFGECACGKPPGVGCLLDRVPVRSSHGHMNSSHPPHPKQPRKKPRRVLPQISPLSTGRATNSRAGSEGWTRVDVDEEADARSVSGSGSASARSKPSSRDITPAMHDGSIGLGVELSTREQRKLQQSEKLFEQMEKIRSTGTDTAKRRKRTSGGSTVNTPTMTTSVSIPRVSAEVPSDSRQRQLPSNTSPTTASNSGRRLNGRNPFDPRRRPLPNGTSHSPPKLAYTEAATQTECQIEAPEVDEHVMRLRRRNRGSFAKMQLNRIRKGMCDRSSVGADTPSVGSPSRLTPASDLPESRSDMPPPPPPAQLKEASISEPAEASPDTEMKDAETETSPRRSPVVLQPPPQRVRQETKAPPKLDKDNDTEMEDVRTKAESPEAEPPKPEPSKLERPKPEPIKADPPKPTPPSAASKHPLPPKPSLQVPLPSPVFTTRPQLQSPIQVPTPSFPPPATPSAATSPVTATSVTTSRLALAVPSPGTVGTSPTLLQSPLTPSAPPLASPLAPPGAAAPSPPQPVKKKLSLSAYVDRKKKAEAAQAAASSVGSVAQSSPLATTAVSSTEAKTDDAMDVDAKGKQNGAAPSR
jgi:hypothetical protein